ncbi:MAG TPA: cytochrome c3 family protein [Clostridia bacterium]|nr:cytochrome c3 family protein [Clostridia bacterium]
MKRNNRMKQAPALALAMVLSAMAVSSALAAAPAAPVPRLDLRPVTSSDIKDYGLPATTQISGGLATVGIGQAVYLEALVDIAIPTADILNVSWVLTNKPAGSAATFTASPLGVNVPIYEPSSRATLKVAGRSLLRPDVTGRYTIEAIVTTPGKEIRVTRNVVAGTYMGLNTCKMCHSGSEVVPDMVTPWAGTAHATMLTKAIDGLRSDHYGKNCISCHTLGFDTNPSAVNGGFDDVAAQLGYTFPTLYTNGNWAAMPAALKNLSNIQCESCHGPGSEHAYSLGKIEMISVSYGSGNCGQCHDAKTHHKNNAEWNNSRHAIATSYAAGPSRADCVKCHSGIGFAETASALPIVNTAYEPITCAACHDPHDAANPHQLRKVGPVQLMDGTVVANAGNGALCMNCHMSRRDAAAYVETASGGGQFGPHHGPQADMLMGVNGVTYGKFIPSSAHRSVVGDACVTCHMQTVAASSPAFTHAGGHTFSLKYDGGTPDIHTDDVEVVEACIQCHGPTTEFNFKREDYDGNGVIQGVQDEVKGLLNQLALLLPPAGVPKADITIGATWTRPQLRAAYNYRFVQEDKSFGVHNLSFAVGLLKASIADIKDDADNDGISDTWEIARFGSITSYCGTDDVDGDGVSNALELAAGTNPLLADSDNDGISDLAELRAGSDPLNAQDKPGFVVKIHNAAELEFASEVGKTYQLQKVSELTGAWENFGEAIAGTGNMVTRLTSMRENEQAYFRVVLVP